jgi:hypothetical protein
MFLGIYEHIYSKNFRGRLVAGGIEKVFDNCPGNTFIHLALSILWDFPECRYNFIDYLLDNPLNFMLKTGVTEIRVTRWITKPVESAAYSFAGALEKFLSSQILLAALMLTICL